MTDDEFSVPAGSVPAGSVPAGTDQATVRVTARTQVADDVVALTLEHPQGDRLPAWTPGSHVDLVLPNGLTRQYSLCGDRWDPFTYRVAVLREPTGRRGSAWVHDTLRPGDLLGLGGPRNHFPMVPSDEYLFIAGGIGITPLLPMIRQADMMGAEWKLLYGGRRRTSMAFRDELERYGDRVRLVPQDEYGLLDLATWLGEPREGTKVYCCGPAPLLAAAESACSPWPEYTLRTERFTPPELDAPARKGPFDVELRRSGKTVTVDPDVSILDAVRGVGIDMLSSCRQGTCGTCETTVLDGIPDHRDCVLDEAERAAGDCMLICVSRSRTDRLVLDL